MGKVILRMDNVTFQYPTKDKPTIMDVSLTVSQVSRVAVIGANGAGKSTAIKVHVGEQKPSEGTIWKAAGLRLAYVAQHAFHHLEKHMGETPVQYIMWRFAGNDDKESLEFKSDEQQLTQPGIERHLADFGVDAESASHTQINQLSGGMKVKVVLAAAMWQNPHVLILDEPTNYLDREGLGALVLAIKDYKGGVLIISHNKEFCENVATEKWIMKGGYLRIEGESKADENEEASGNVAKEDVYDGAGNKIDVKQNVALSAKDAKKAIKDIEKKIKDNKKKKTLTDDELWELEDKLNELKEKLQDAK